MPGSDGQWRMAVLCDRVLAAKNNGPISHAYMPRPIRRIVDTKCYTVGMVGSWFHRPENTRYALVKPDTPFNDWYVDLS